MRRTWQHTAFADPDGTEYRLDEPELLLWVHCAEISSYTDIARRAGMPLARGDAGTSNGPGDRLILPATRAARNQARAFQRARAARHLAAVL